MSKNRYTPETLVGIFTIPLYQRLFEWEEPQILQLLKDLYASFNKDKSSPYYIGMFTLYKAQNDERYSLVDGQQRFTVLMLMGIVFEWNDFLIYDNILRLSFFARKNDEAYLKEKIQKSEPKYINKKMNTGISCIQKFVDTIKNKDAKEFEDFKTFIFQKTTFFISELPESYILQDLNRYFEAMNEAGKGLESHEILKVRLLKNANPEKYEEYASIWNSVSEIDRSLIRQGEQEKKEAYRKRNIDLFKSISFQSVFDSSLIKNDDLKDESKLSIKDIKHNPKKPQESENLRSERAILSFTDFLLQVLWLCLNKDDRTNSADFFNKNKLHDTFDKHIFKSKNIDINNYFESLLKFRVLFDYYIIRLNNNDGRNVTYSLNQVTDDREWESKRNLIQFQSMLYVSMETYLWLTDALEYFNSTVEININDSLHYLKSWDNERHNKHELSLNYGSIDRYWFWRLDYYLWLERDKLFEEKAKKVADNYIFRPNRSIEHIAPQNPKSESKVIIEVSHLHMFGNLAMISSGQNSSLQNESFEVKRAHVESFINRSIGGSIQSLKMLKIYKFETWNVKNVESHHDSMIRILINSFNNNENKYSEIIKQLEKLLIELKQKD